MTEPVVCHEGRCRYRIKKGFIDDNIDDDLMQQIEKDLLKENMAM